ncbi:hypothetical protein JYQ62_27885 [Nostoc sp. UHCC 0702]|nr:hypothetical protein JYQ62_27885 [Nostoc sp. UHCC 0702]
MHSFSRYRTNQFVICINQDVPTYFNAVQRSRLPMIAVPLDRGLSVTYSGEVNQKLLYQQQAQKLAIRPPPHHSNSI